MALYRNKSMISRADGSPEIQRAMMAQQSNSSRDNLSPLRKWIEDEGKKQIFAQKTGCFAEEKCKRELILRKATVAYGIAELLRNTRGHPRAAPWPLSLGEQCSIDNFLVRASGGEAAAATVQCSLSTWNDIKGVDMISPQLSVNIAEPSFLCGGFCDNSDSQEYQMGRYLEAEFPTLIDTGRAAAAVSQSEEHARCHSLGVILYELFSQLSPLPAEGLRGDQKKSRKKDGPESDLKNGRVSPKPASKKARLLDPKSPSPSEHFNSAQIMVGESNGESNSISQKVPYVPLKDLGFPSSLCLLVENLLECGDDCYTGQAYDSIDAVIKDLHLLLLDPSRFLFDCKLAQGGCAQLVFRKNKLYGRENEVSLITDAFCRVSGGKSEAFFIGGFSGSGKSMLVNSLTARVDIMEGYVITHKFDQMSKERPLYEVISVFDGLCVLIKEKSSQLDLLAIINKLMDVFGTDFSVLARLLPSISVLSPQQKETVIEREDSNQMNLRSICFILQRFMRVVSSKSHPVMLFLDDLQWCDHSALTLIEGILCDAIGSSCLFFVGSYRSNEIQADHDVLRLMDSLSSFGIPTTKLSLEGLQSEDLNTMLSDAMCIFPRICKPLSDIVFQKTKGNPFFVLEFLRSLVREGLLEYSICKRRWVWDESRISSMEITGNVLCLLSSKMSGLSENIQLALKIAACFGTKIRGSAVGYLSTHSEYSNLRDGLEQVVKEGFMIKFGASDFKFVHDKVREAAYGLIPSSAKSQYHYKLGMILYSRSKGCNVDDIVFSIADQINHGIKGSLTQSPELQIDLAKLNENAGVKAVNHSDFITAHSYFNTALFLLPTDHWKSHYDQSIRLSFLLAKSAYSCGDVEKAYDILQTILNQAHRLSDKLDAYHLVVVILNDREAVEEAYTTTYEVLLQLGEAIPDSFGHDETKEMVKTTAKMLSALTEESLLGMKEMERAKQYLLKFYGSITVVSFFAKPAMVPYFTCRMVQLSMKYGICKYSIIGFVQYAAMTCVNNMVTNLQDACRIGKLAMASLKRFDSSTSQVPTLFFIYYGFVAIVSEQVQACAENLRRGFECAIANGDTSIGFVNSVHHIRMSLIAGIDLPTLLERVEYYLEVMKRHGNTWAKTHMLLYRDTISTLMGKRCSENSEVQHNSLKFPAETTHYHKAMRAFWIGHSERCHHFIEKLFQGINNSGGRHHRRFFMLYHGLNSFKIIRRTSSQKLKAVPRNALGALKTAAEYSRWNFRNKVHLLEAEIFSYEGKMEEAKASYAAAISSARSSKFIHEQGLACELAGFHYKKIGDHRSAWGFFNHAKQCYADWGSQFKVDSITRQLESFQISLTR